METVEGSVEQVTYANPDSGWCVLRLSTANGPVNLVGNLFGVQVGETIRAHGEWSDHRRFGRQLKVENYLAVAPTTELGICRYLASGVVKGLGKVMAERLVAHFGIDTLQVIDHEPHRLTEVAGIGPKRAKELIAAWERQRGVREVMVFLRGHDLSAGFAQRIYRRYGFRSIDKIKQDPYRLASEVRGIGFLTADRLAQRLGIDRGDSQRLRAGLLYSLREASVEGHVYLPRETLLTAATTLLEVAREPLVAALESLQLSGEVVSDTIDTPTGSLRGVYEKWNYAAECQAATRFALLIASAEESRQLYIDALAEVEQELGFPLAEQQRLAVQLACEQKVMVLTGGPGTGKTTIVRAITEIFKRRGARLAVAAPTGRAARRLSESTQLEGHTLHRLLEFSPKEGKFLRNAEQPLELDLLVVDEFSMVDNELFARLLEALPPESRLVIVGDDLQLPSVGAGNVLSDVIESGRVSVVVLEEIFRQAQSSLITVNAHRIQRGEMPLSAGKEEDGDFYFIQQDEPEQIVDTIKRLVAERIPRRFDLNPIDDVQVLSPMQKGELGVIQLNAQLQELLNPAGQALRRGDRSFRSGDRVMQLRNNYDNDVFNGDVGRVRQVDTEAQTLIVDFEGREVEYQQTDLDELGLAYAISIHKSQGSEYPVVVLPLHTSHYVMLRRNLFYTAITRGRRLVMVVGSQRAARLAVEENRVEPRYTALSMRIRQAIDNPLNVDDSSSEESLGRHERTNDARER